MKKSLLLFLTLALSIFLANTNAYAVQSYDFKGTIGKKIPVEMWFEVNKTINKDNTVRDENITIRGEITYLNTSDKKPIILLGDSFYEYDDYTSVTLYEMLPNGDISGCIYEAEIKDNQLIGEWSSPRTPDKKLPIKLTKSDKKHTPYNWKKLPANLVGEYKREWKDNFLDSLTVSKHKDNTVSFIIDNYNINPNNGMPSMADLCIRDDNGNSLPIDGILNGQKILVSASDDPDRICRAEITFYEDFAVSTPFDEGCVGLWGMRGTIKGMFLKIK